MGFAAANTRRHVDSAVIGDYDDTHMGEMWE
jgi:hypothetical protein